MFCSLLAEHIEARRMHFSCHRVWMIFWSFIWTLFGHILDIFWIYFRDFYFSKDWNYTIEVILNVLFLVGRAHRGKKNALFVQKFMVWWALSRINRARRTNVKKRQKKSEIEKPDFAMTAIGALHLCWFLAVGSWIMWFIWSCKKTKLLEVKVINLFSQNGQVWT